MNGPSMADALAGRLGSPVVDLKRLSGGASRETWSFSSGGERLILRRDPPGGGRTSMLREAALLAEAARVGVPVPALVDASDDRDLLGSAFLVMAHVDGETIPRRLLREPEYSAARRRLGEQCGEVLAQIHTMDVTAIPGLERVDELARYRQLADQLGDAHPAFELAFRWLEDHRPTGDLVSVVHGDFRNGNLIVGPEGLRAVLDWELSHVGDPFEDLGWLCVKSWRFGVDRPVGGFGTYEELERGYGERDRDRLTWWEVMGSLKWGIMCILQSRAHISGAVRSVELAALGRRVCEVEWDLLEALP